MPSKKMNKKTILFATDLGEKSKDYINYLSQFSTAANLSIETLYVEDNSLFPSQGDVYRNYWEQVIGQRKKQLNELTKENPSKAKIKFGFPGGVILSEAKKATIGLIAMGTHGRKGLKRLLIGSVAEDVVRHAPKPVLVFGPQVKEVRFNNKLKGNSKTKNAQVPIVLVATDLGKNSKKAENFAESLAKQMGAKIVFVHSVFEGYHPVIQTAFSAPNARAELSELAEKSIQTATKTLEIKVKALKSKKVLAEYILDTSALSATASILKAIQKQSPSLIVLGTHGRNLVAQSFLGRTARDVLLESSVPVISVKSNG